MHFLLHRVILFRSFLRGGLQRARFSTPALAKISLSSSLLHPPVVSLLLLLRCRRFCWLLVFFYFLFPALALISLSLLPSPPLCPTSPPSTSFLSSASSTLFLLSLLLNFFSPPSANSFVFSYANFPTTSSLIRRRLSSQHRCVTASTFEPLNPGAPCGDIFGIALLLLLPRPPLSFFLAKSAYLHSPPRHTHQHHNKKANDATELHTLRS